MLLQSRLLGRGAALRRLAPRHATASCAQPSTSSRPAAPQPQQQQQSAAPPAAMASALMVLSQAAAPAAAWAEEGDAAAAAAAAGAQGFSPTNLVVLAPIGIYAAFTVYRCAMRMRAGVACAGAACTACARVPPGVRNCVWGSPRSMQQQPRCARPAPPPRAQGQSEPKGYHRRPTALRGTRRHPVQPVLNCRVQGPLLLIQWTNGPRMERAAARTGCVCKSLHTFVGATEFHRTCHHRWL